MKYIYQSLKRLQGDRLVICFSSNARGNDFEKSILGMYCSLLYNLFDKKPSLLMALDHCERSGYHNILANGWNLEMLEEVFEEAVLLLRNARKRVYYFVDALDECPVPEIRELINHFKRLVGITESQYSRVCFSSRHYPQISIETG